ncbi:hypothetical protein HK101_001620 [Irineochytrium annulatum]|nr:hypothetical protein HK101_001620 [Irineochytrium annulatum]
MDSMDKTVKFNVKGDEQEASSKEILLTVYDALVDKEYNPINQIVGYLISGDPAYIPRHNNARSLVRKKERDELIEELAAGNEPTEYSLKLEKAMLNRPEQAPGWESMDENIRDWKYLNAAVMKASSLELPNLCVSMRLDRAVRYALLLPIACGMN